MGNVYKDVKIKTGSPTDLKILLLMNLIYQRVSARNIPKNHVLTDMLVKIPKSKADLKSNKFWQDSFLL